MIETKYKIRIVCLILFALLIGFGIYKFMNKCDCNDVYLGVCFDESSEYYMSNLDKQMTILEDWKIVNVIKYFEENNITIYGRSDCSWCQKQLNEFGSFVDSLYEKRLYIDCLKETCEGITSTPSWKKNNKLIGSGYLPVNDLFESIK